MAFQMWESPPFRAGRMSRSTTRFSGRNTTPPPVERTMPPGIDAMIARIAASLSRNRASPSVSKNWRMLIPSSCSNR